MSFGSHGKRWPLSAQGSEDRSSAFGARRLAFVDRFSLAHVNQSAVHCDVLVDILLKIKVAFAISTDAGNFKDLFHKRPATASVILCSCQKASVHEKRKSCAET
jgi:hypothetical protein